MYTYIEIYIGIYIEVYQHMYIYNCASFLRNLGDTTPCRMIGVWGWIHTRVGWPEWLYTGLYPQSKRPLVARRPPRSVYIHAYVYIGIYTYIYIHTYIYIYVYKVRALPAQSPPPSLITLEPRVEWCKSLWASSTSPPRNRFTFLRRSCSYIDPQPWSIDFFSGWCASPPLVRKRDL